MTSNTPNDFDWINARADCSMLLVFLKLQSECEADVESMNKRSVAMEPQGVKPHFCCESNEAKTQFWVFGNVAPRMTVRFVLHNDHIAVETSGEKLSITLTLNNEGKCKLRVDGADELDRWQLRKLVLEELFFGR